MKTEQEIKKRIEQLIKWRTEDHLLDPRIIQGSLMALGWVLGEKEEE